MFTCATVPAIGEVREPQARRSRALSSAARAELTPATAASICAFRAPDVDLAADNWARAAASWASASATAARRSVESTVARIAPRFTFCPTLAVTSVTLPPTRKDRFAWVRGAISPDTGRVTCWVDLVTWTRSYPGSVEAPGCSRATARPMTATTARAAAISPTRLRPEPRVTAPSLCSVTSSSC